MSTPVDRQPHYTITNIHDEPLLISMPAGFDDKETKRVVLLPGETWANIGNTALTLERVNHPPQQPKVTDAYAKGETKGWSGA